MTWGWGAMISAFWMLAALSLPAQQSSTPPARSGPETEPFVFRVTTREVLLEVLATDRHDHPIRDLREDEIQVFEIQGRSKIPVASISKFRAVDPAQPEQTQPSPLRVTVGGGCAARATFHYELAYHPGTNGWTSGYHKVEARTTRRDVKLAYRDRYYAAESVPLQKGVSAEKADSELREAACFHADVPATVVLRARPVATGRPDVFRYFVTVDADSLAFVTMSGQSRWVQLDYGICTFDGAGHGLQYLHASVDRSLSTSEYAQAVVHGFPHLLEFPRDEKAAMTRVVLRDRATGNIGSLDIQLAAPDSGSLTPDEQSAMTDWVKRAQRPQDDIENLGWPPLGPIGSFGSLLPRPGALCGDVYEIPNGTGLLPVFWNLSSIGSLYAETLNVPHQQFWKTGGLPGLTRRTDWFGIDYHGTFWVSSPGDYQFTMLVDDGGKLYIDDQRVIDLDGLHMLGWKEGQITLTTGEHSIHVPYFQGPQNAVALTLLVKAPGDQEFKPFDMREFSRP